MTRPMIDETILKIEKRLAAADTLTAEQRAELLRLLATLKQEMAALSLSDLDHARSIAGYADLALHEATRVEKKPKLFRHALEGLRSATFEFEQAHPQLVDTVNRICVSLLNLGI